MSYPGGKNGSGVYHRIINQMPPHKVYVEAFLGGGAVMMRKRPAHVNIGLDLSLSALDKFKDEYPYPERLDLYHDNALVYLNSNPWDSNMLVYCDPPYLLATRSSKREMYDHEMNRAEHQRLLDIIAQLPCMVMISGYYSEMYAEALRDWRTITYQTRTRGGTTRTEWLWMNYPEPIALHDYQYLGDNYRERERIKRKRHRWMSRLREMPHLERLAIIRDIETVFD